MSHPIPFPATPPNLPNSISLPSIPPSPSSNQPPKSKNYHPYLIQSTSSSLLTRSNSSPSQPLSSLAKHKPSRSMSHLNQHLEEGVSVSLSPVGAGSGTEEGEGRRKSMESPSARPGMRRSGTLPSFLEGDTNKGKTGLREVVLPLNPNTWTPSELAQYLGYTLRTGGPDGSGQILPGPLVEDIKTWVLRQHVTGRAFLKGNSEGWASASRPPPFLPLLLTLSRRLRRSSLQGRISRTSDSSRSLNLSLEDRNGSVLMEERDEDEDEDFEKEDEVEEVSKVKRMANAFEARESGSEDENGMEGLKAQSTGGSAGGWGLRRQNTGGSVGGPNVRARRESFMSASGMSPVTRMLELRESSPESDIVTPFDENKGQDKAVKVELGIQVESVEPSPPPPYTSPSKPDEGTPDFPSRLTPLPVLDRHDRLSVTPTPERPVYESTGLGIITSPPSLSPSPSKSSMTTTSPHMSNMQTHKLSGFNPYAALKRSSSSRSSSGNGPRLPTLASIRAQAGESDTDGADEAEVDPQSKWSTARRVTLRPNTVAGLFNPAAPVKSVREVELEDQLSTLLSRVQELESRLESVESRPEEVNGTGRVVSQPVSPILDLFPEVILDKLGLGLVNGLDDDGMPKRLRELPAYLFLVGFGVGAVMVRVLFGRTR